MAMASSLAHGSRACSLSHSPCLREALSSKRASDIFRKTLCLMIPNCTPSSSCFSSSSFPLSLPVASRFGYSKRGFAVSAQSEPKEPACSTSSNTWMPRQWNNGGGWFYEGANIDSSAIVEAGAVVHAGASVGPSSRIGSGSVVGSDVFIGRETVLSFNVKLQNCTVGDRCILHNGVAVGQDGFGFYVDEQGNMVKKPQNLRVVIGNEIEIGANTCIDRGSWRDTVIGDYTKIDNLVQIGHNVVIGRCCVICGQVGIGGSVTIGDYVVLAGQVGVADHVTITSKVRIGAKSGVTSNIETSGDYAGFPVTDAKEWRRMIALQRRAMKKEKSI